MELADRKRFFEELWSECSEGHDTPLTLKYAPVRFKEAISAMNVVWCGYGPYWWDGVAYIPLSMREVQAGIMYCMDRAGLRPTAKYLKELRWQCRVRLEGESVLEMDNGWISLRNGMLNMDDRNVRMVEHSPDYLVTRYLDFDYDREAKCPLWHQFLDEVLPDQACQDLLQEFLGACLLNRQRYKIESMLWLYGEGANGKSVVFETVVGVFGQMNVSARDMRELLNVQRGMYALSDIDGKILNYCSDVQGEFVFTDLAKKIISGEPLHAERKFENARLITRLPLMMANTNTLPKLGDKTLSWARRVKIIPFNVTIPEEKQDKSLALKLAAERSGIFSWILEGRRRFLRQECRFSPCPQGDLLMYEYRSSGYDVLDFMQNEGYASRIYNTGDEGRVLLSKDLYKVFLSWLEVEGAPEFTKIAYRSFCTKLKRYGYAPIHRRDGVAIRVFTLPLKSTPKKRRGKAVPVPDAPPEEEIKAAPALEGSEEGRGAMLARLKREMEEEL